jgi:hypothetical protein
MSRRVAIFAILLFGACDDTPPPAPDYYNRVIQPILTASCIRNQGGCHKDDGTGSALGNLDLTSYENTTRRKDVTRTYGSFPEPLLLLKGAGPGTIIPYKPGRGDGMTAFLDTQIQHAGGAPIARNSQAFFVLQQWLANGATSDGAPADKVLSSTGHGSCTKDFASARPDLAAKFDVTMVMDDDPNYQKFQSDVEPIISANCAFGECHSSPQSDFFLACDGGDGTKFNFLEAKEFISAPPESSEFLLRPLAPASGGVSHTGGVFFASKSDDNYVKMLAWATMVGPPTNLAMRSPGRVFFDSNVMPILLQRGCALEACHSPGSANDFKLRPGSQGYFSASALERNYEEARRNFLVADVPDVRVSRIARKPVVKMSEGGVGIAHRGGPVLQSPNDPPNLDPTMCPPYDPATSTPFCTLVEWHRLERMDLITAGQAEDLGQHTQLVYVDRAPDSDGPTDIDQYRPDADLMLATVTLGPLAHFDSVTPLMSLLGTCPGTKATRDVRRPDVDYDASRVVFAMRTDPAGAFDLYTVGLDGTGCAVVPTGKSGPMMNGLPVHDLDPLFAPTTPSSIVFASTRGKSGPSLSLKYLRVQTDLWRLPGMGMNAFGAPVQMTALLGSELYPSMMLNGEVSFTAEKASADFYQLSGRRINWDGTDYHPLLAQRKTSPGFNYVTGMLDMMPDQPSVNFQRALEIREGLDRNFVFVASDDTSPGIGGQLVTFNRSVGPFEADRTNIGFLHSLEVIDDGMPGGYRSPAQLPDGRYLASYSGDLGGGSYDLVIVDPAGPAGARRSTVLACPGRACVQAVMAYKRERRPLFNNVAQLVFGGHVDGSDPTHGTVSYPDLPMLATLLAANLRTGRFVDQYRGAKQVAIYQDLAPTDAASGAAGQVGSEKVYQNRMLYGTAPLNDDGSAKLRLPSLTPMIIELQDASGKPIFTMSEEDQLGPGEVISRGVPQGFFNSVCGGCHGSVSGRELDIAIDPDALTGASVSSVHDASPQSLGP